LGYSKFINEHFGFGIEGGHSVLRGHDPYQTYSYEGGAVSYESHRYVYYYTLMANAQYYFFQGKYFIPYASLGMGLAYSQYKEFYNVYQDADEKTAFGVRPEVGTLFRIKEHAGWGLKAAIGYDYTTNKSEYFNTENLSSLNFQFGVVFLTH
jgi:opacity protein-like surface antigen